MNKPDMNKAKIRNTHKIEYKNYIHKTYDLSGKTFLIKTYGCQMNEHDSEKIKGMLLLCGGKEVYCVEYADIVILNTCAIRENAHDKVFGFLGRLKHLKKTKKDLIIGVCGCMAQEESVVNEILERYKYINFVCGTHDLEKIPQLVNNSFEDNKIKVEAISYEGDVIENIPVNRDSKYSAWVDIIYGCDKFCTYCIVPYTRGTQRSRKHEDIIKEVIELKNNGYKEITLLGQNVNAYGKDLCDDYTLANLLDEVADTGIERIRFVTSHPWDFTDEMIEVISKRENIMPYIHLPIQSGSNRILKLMNRRYTKESYLELYNKIRTKVKNVSITTDIIVGFPGETNDDFNDTIDIVNMCKFDGAFTFAFSKRENTPASYMEETVTEEQKLERLHRLNEIVNKYSLEANKKLEGTCVKCLVTAVSEKDNNKVCGYTENMKLVNIVADKETIGKIINVRITSAKSFSLDGEYID